MPIIIKEEWEYADLQAERDLIYEELLSKELWDSLDEDEKQNVRLTNYKKSSQYDFYR